MIEAIDFASEAPALFVEERCAAISYRELGRRVDECRDLVRTIPRPALAFMFAPNGVGSIAAYLACLAEGMPLGLGETSASARARVIAAYEPSLVFLPEGEPEPSADYRRVAVPRGGLALWRRHDGTPYRETPHPELALLLATSGSTGDAKFVRLSRGNLLANARSISAYLQLGPTEVAVQSLPLHYSYGLSVLNSHLVAGGTVALTLHSFMRPEFWRAVDECGVTSFAGVPYMYETMHRLRIMPAARATLRTLTQAGGHLRPEHVRHFNDGMRARGGRLFVMYGQTEATARMAYVPADRLAEKLGFIGVAIPDGELWLEQVETEPALRQLCYRGANVMLGYANGPADLALGDEQRGQLATGDLGECDGDGFFRITGRLTRFAKLFGKRINLASIEAEVEKVFTVRAAAVDGGDHLRLFLESGDLPTVDRVRTFLADFLSVPPLALKVITLPALPLTASGKKDYKALA